MFTSRAAKNNTDYSELYKTNDSFREYVNKMIRNRPEMTVEQACSLKLVQEVGDMYASGKNRPAYESIITRQEG